MINIRLDDRIEMYKSYLDYEWLKPLEKRCRGTKLEELMVALMFAWKATANAYAMPYFMMTILKSFEEGYLRGRDSMPEEKLKLLAEHLPKRMAAKHKLSNMKQQQFKEMIAQILEEVKVMERSIEVTDIKVAFRDFLYGPGGSEWQMGTFGLCQTCYGSTIHAYEHFVSQCIKIAKNDARFQARRWSQIVTAATAEFGEDVTKFCLAHDRVTVARAIRNSLAHNGGETSPDMFGRVRPEDYKRLADELAKEVFIEGGEIRIVPTNNINLFNMLKVRVSRLVDKALTMRQFKLEGG